VLRHRPRRWCAQRQMVRPIHPTRRHSSLNAEQITKAAISKRSTLKLVGSMSVSMPARRRWAAPALSCLVLLVISRVIRASLSRQVVRRV
jgi:hypothetical protein